MKTLKEIHDEEQFEAMRQSCIQEIEALMETLEETLEETLDPFYIKFWRWLTRKFK